MLVIEKLKKSYRNNPVLSGVELSVHTGEITGIIGKNGAGKTTLFQSIAGLINYEGNISFTPNALSKHIGYLPTNPPMLKYITGKEYIQLLVNAREIDVEYIDQLNIFSLPLEQYATEYSTGMLKKLALTGILMQRNEIYMLDEPFNGLDIESVAIVTEVIKRLKSMGKIVLLSSHITQHLFEICDAVYLLNHGKLKPIDKTQSDQAILNPDEKLKLNSTLNDIFKKT